VHQKHDDFLASIGIDHEEIANNILGFCKEFQNTFERV
jgi:hypothetical protein